MFTQVKKDFISGKINKIEMFTEMNKTHRVLYDYRDYIKNTNCKNIIITEDDVIFTFVSNGIDIKMTCSKHDISSVPFTHLSFGFYDLKETKYLLKIIKEDDVIFDVGANSGWYSIHWLKKFKNTIVYSFEPFRETYKKLYRNIRLNNEKTNRILNRSKIFNIGLSDKESKENFYVDTQRFGASSLKKIQDHDFYKEVSTEFNTIDNIVSMNKLQRLDFIKIDVEGAEKLVVNGGIETIKKFKPVLYIELLRKWSRKFEYNPNEVLSKLKEIGYVCYVINNNLSLTIVNEITEETKETNFLFKTIERCI